MLGKSYAMAACVVTVAKDLTAQADMLNSRLQDLMAPGCIAIRVEVSSSFVSNKGTPTYGMLLGQTHSSTKDWDFWSSLHDCVHESMKRYVLIVLFM